VSSLSVYIERFVYIASLPWHCYVALVYRPKTSLVGPNLFVPPTFIKMKTLKSLTDANSRSIFILFFYLWTGTSIFHEKTFCLCVLQFLDVFQTSRMLDKLSSSICTPVQFILPGNRPLRRNGNR